jgi:hypothetical protein
VPNNPRNKWEVIVSNMGRVHEGTNGKQANVIYREYVRQSRADIGRASGESVTLICNDEPVLDYRGTLEMPEQEIAS